MKDYFAYIRVSTARQGAHGSSLQEQKSAIEDYAQKHDLTIVAWFEDRMTAAKRGRYHFDRMIAALSAGQVQGVIVHKIDRSARNFADWGRLGELLDRGVEVRVAHDGLDLTTRSGRLMADMQAVLAVDYIRNLRDEVKKGLYGRLKQGIYPFKAPRGYRDCGGGKVKEIDPVEGPLVRTAFELYDSGDYSVRSLINEMYRRGFTSTTGGRIGVGPMGHLLHNPYYIGLIRLGDGRTYVGVHEPLISKSLFDRVQDRLAGKCTAKVRTYAHPFRRLLRCLGCGRSLVGERQKGHVYYRCHVAECRGATIREDRVRELVSGFFEIFLLSDEDLRDLRDVLHNAESAAQRNVEAGRRQLELALGNLETRRGRLTDALIDGQIDKDSFEARNYALLAERRGILEQLEDKWTSPAEEILEKLELGKTAYLKSISSFEHEIRESLKITNSNLLVAGKNLTFEPYFPFDEIAKARVVLGGWDSRNTYRMLDPILEQKHLHLLPPLRELPAVVRHENGNWVLQ